MPHLALSPGFALPHLITEISPDDTMFAGDAQHYLNVGVSALHLVEAALHDAPAPRTILDLPCGFGRVTRFLRARYPRAAITVCDLDRRGVEFAMTRFDAREAYSTRNFRDLQLGASFDLIWVGSLLTHLPEHQTRQFLDFAARHMAPESRLVVTSHGEHVATQLRSSTYGLSEAAARGLVAQYLAEGYGYRGYDGGPDYGISLAARAWYETLLDGSALRLLAYYERGWDRHQDVLVLRRAPEAVRDGRMAAPPPRFDRPDVALPLSAEEQEAQDSAGVTGFDETWYRNTFGDVARAVRDGECPSGLAHYMAYGWQEGRPPFDPERYYARRTGPVVGAWLDGRVGRTSEAWSVSPEDQADKGGWYWLAHPTVRARVNQLASGDSHLDAYDRLATLLSESGCKLPLSRSVSLGCGFGALERDLSARGLVLDVDAYDIALGAIEGARLEAQRLELQRLRYHVADLEKIDLPPGSVDAVFAHSSVHHVEQLEALYAVVQRTLRPGGIFHLHEFVGPTRFQWTDAQLRIANEFLDSLPPRLRRLPNGTPKEALRRPSIAEMIAADPSEAVRSAELIQALEPFFEVVEHRLLGGAVAHLALGGIAQNFDPTSVEDEAILRRLFETEDAAMADGTIASDFATVTAIPKPVVDRRGGTAMTRSLTARAASLIPLARYLSAAARRFKAVVSGS